MDNLAIVIVNWNTTAFLDNCLKSIKNNLNVKKVKVYVIDNASSDDVKALAKKYPFINLTLNNINVGFGKANNQILKSLKTKYVLILNPDTEITKNSIEALVTVLESDSKIAAVGPQLLDKFGHLQKEGFYRKYPSLIQTLLFYTDIHRLAEKSIYLRHKFWESNVEVNKISEVEQIPGACLLIKMDLFRKVGFFSDSFPFWFEDVDLCFNLTKRGYKLLYVQGSKVKHIGGASWAKWSDVSSREVRFLKSMFTFFDKHFSFAEGLVVRFIILSSLFFMFTSRSLMQLFDHNIDRGKFIQIKINVFKKLFLSPEPLPTI